MNIIKEIRIKYFRSIYNLKLKDINDCIIFSGKNDVGKSNIVKALNLFFNNQSDWLTDFDFYNDFNFKRLQEVREESIKGKQYIQIEIVFRRGKNFLNTLPDEFSVKKTWDRNSNLPKQTDDLERKLKQGKIKNESLNLIQRSLTQYLNKIRFEYVPAIKDKRLFTHLLNQLQNEIFNQLNKKGEKITEEIENISKKYSKTVGSLKSEFKASTGINSELALPISSNELFKVLNVVTDFDEFGKTSLNLDYRGDGIRLRFIPSLFNYLAENYRGNFILGFEEPENSMEYGLGTKMAHEFFNVYSKNSQIFITSHSPAFLNSTNDNVNYFRIYRESEITNAVRVKMNNGIFALEKGEQNNAKLIEELGLVELQKDFHKAYEEKFKEAEKNISIIESLNEQISVLKKPVLYTEGKTDVRILKTAYSQLYPGKEPPFDILPVETTSLNGGDGGYTALNRKIESVKVNEKLQIGLYDRDEGGYKKGFCKLNKNLIKYSGKEYIKQHKNKMSYALVFPPQSGLEKFVKYCNLPIEFLFKEEYIKKKNAQGQGLILLPFQREITFGGETVENIKKDEIHLCSINKDSKKIFAEEIVQSFPQDAFDYFKVIFEEIETIISQNEAQQAV